MRSLSRRIVEHGWIELRRRRFPSPLALITSTSTREGTRVPDRDQPRKGAVILDRDRNRNNRWRAGSSRMVASPSAPIDFDHRWR